MSTLITRAGLTCVLLLAGSHTVLAQTVKLEWDAPADPGVTGYVVYYGEVSGRYLATVDVGPSTRYTFSNLPVGVTYYFTVRSYNETGTMSTPASEVSTVVASDFVRLSNDFRPAPPPVKLPRFATPFDYDGDARADVAVFRPSTGQWHVSSGANQTPWGVVSFGQNGDVPLSGDFDGDRRMDPAVYRPSTGRWYILNSSTGFGSIQSYSWGYSSDVALTADFDGDRRADIVVYRPSTGMWYVLRSSTGFTQWWTQKWGLESSSDADRPAAADYDGDGLADFAVYRPSTGVWYVLYSADGYTTSSAVKWGLDTTALPVGYVGDGKPDTPVAADYDGDGRADLAVFRNSSGMWYVIQSSTQQGLSVKWGVSADVPVPADYDGDGVTDIAVFRPSTSEWHIYNQGRRTWGLSTDLPIQRR